MLKKMFFIFRAVIGAFMIVSGLLMGQSYATVFVVTETADTDDVINFDPAVFSTPQVITWRTARETSS